MVALYPSVPTDRGLVRLREALTNSGMGGNKVGWLCRCMEVILRGNIFKFKESYTHNEAGPVSSHHQRGAMPGCTWWGWRRGAQWERLVREETMVRELVRFIDYC